MKFNNLFFVLVCAILAQKLEFSEGSWGDILNGILNVTVSILGNNASEVISTTNGTYKHSVHVGEYSKKSKHKYPVF